MSEDIINIRLNPKFDVSHSPDVHATAMQVPWSLTRFCMPCLLSLLNLVHTHLGE